MQADATSAAPTRPAPTDIGRTRRGPPGVRAEDFKLHVTTDAQPALKAREKDYIPKRTGIIPDRKQFTAPSASTSRYEDLPPSVSLASASTSRKRVEASPPAPARTIKKPRLSSFDTSARPRSLRAERHDHSPPPARATSSRVRNAGADKVIARVHSKIKPAEPVGLADLASIKADVASLKEFNNARESIPRRVGLIEQISTENAASLARIQASTAKHIEAAQKGLKEVKETQEAMRIQMDQISRRAAMLDVLRSDIDKLVTKQGKRILVLVSAIA